MNDKSFKELQNKAIDAQLCLFCGLCVSICPEKSIEFREDGPKLVGECTNCGRCLKACPGLGSPLDKLDKMVFGRNKSEDEDLSGFGISLMDENFVSCDQKILDHGYTGGKLTGILTYLLEKKEIDGAIISVWGEKSPFPWFSWPVIARTREDIIKGAGSKYTFSPNLMPLREVALNRDIDKIAIVGLGCHIQGLRKLQFLDVPYSNFVKKIKYMFGLYCGAPMVSRDDFMAYIARICDVKSQDITAISFKRVSEEFDVEFDLILKEGKKAGKRMNLLELFEIIRQEKSWHRCTFCTDYSAEYADISFGGFHVTSRTEKGDKLLQQVLADGCLVPAPKNELFEQLAKQIDKAASSMKKKNNRKRLNDFKTRGMPIPDYM